VQGEDANYSFLSDDSILYCNLRLDNSTQLSQYPLGRAQLPGIDIEPIYMLLRGPDELPYSEKHALIITAVDKTNDTGLTKVLEVSGRASNRRKTGRRLAGGQAHRCRLCD